MAEQADLGASRMSPSILAILALVYCNLKDALERHTRKGNLA